MTTPSRLAMTELDPPRALSQPQRYNLVGAALRINPIDEALAALERWGWVKHEWESENGYCITGAFEQIYGTTFRFVDGAEEAARNHLGPAALEAALLALRLIAEEAWGDPATGVMRCWTNDVGLPQQWNDLPETTFDDVRLVLKRASIRYDDACTTIQRNPDNANLDIDVLDTT